MKQEQMEKKAKHKRSQNNEKKKEILFDKLTLLSLPKEEMRSAHSLEDSKFRSAFSMTPS